MDRIPIKAARNFAAKHGLMQVIIFGYDGDLNHVVTYGKTTEQAGQAADFSNRLKTLMGWPDSLHAQPSRVRRLQKRVKELEAALGKSCIVRATPTCVYLADGTTVVARYWERTLCCPVKPFLEVVPKAAVAVRKTKPPRCGGRRP